MKISGIEKKDIFFIDVNPERIPYKFQLKLGKTTYIFSFKYNPQGDFFTVDLSVFATKEILVLGEPIRYGHMLFCSVEDERFPIPVIIPWCLTGEKIDKVTFENFGNQVKLYLFDRKK